MDGVLVFDLNQEFKIDLNSVFIHMRNYGSELYLGGFVKKINKGFSLIQDHPFIYIVFIENTNGQRGRMIIYKYVIVYRIFEEENRFSIINIYYHEQNYYDFY